ncbi:hypothetical protein BG004_000192 [Podila humilis]|nr:hypothetical protein BG004_000192 [Podila humilis]
MTSAIHSQQRPSSSQQQTAPSLGLTERPFSLAPSVLEVNLQRLMAKCQAKVQGSDTILQGADKSKLLMNIKALSEMLADLEEESVQSGRVDLSILKEYETSIEALARLADDGSSVLPVVKGLSQTRMIPTLEPSEEERTREDMLFHQYQSRLNEQEQRKEQHIQDDQDRRRSIQGSSAISRNNLGLRDRKSQRDDNGLRTSEPPKGGVKDQAQIERALQNDRAHREVMEAGLSRLVQQLKHNAQSIQQTLLDERESGLLDDADQFLDRNLSRLGVARSTLDIYSKQSRKTKWLIWGIVFGVSVVFVFMFLVIRIF